MSDREDYSITESVANRIAKACGAKVYYVGRSWAVSFCDSEEEITKPGRISRGVKVAPDGIRLFDAGENTCRNLNPFTTDEHDAIRHMKRSLR